MRQDNFLAPKNKRKSKENRRQAVGVRMKNSSRQEGFEYDEKRTTRFGNQTGRLRLVLPLESVLENSEAGKSVPFRVIRHKR